MSGPVVDYQRALAELVQRYHELPADVRAEAIETDRTVRAMSQASA